MAMCLTWTAVRLTHYDSAPGGIKTLRLVCMSLNHQNHVWWHEALDEVMVPRQNGVGGNACENVIRVAEIAKLLIYNKENYMIKRIKSYYK